MSRSAASYAELTHDADRGAGARADPHRIADRPLIFDASGYETMPGAWVSVCGGRTVRKDIWLPVVADPSEEPVAYLPISDCDGLFVHLHKLRQENFGSSSWTPTGDVCALVGGARWEGGGTQLVRRVRESESGRILDRLAYYKRAERSSSLWICSVHDFEDGSRPSMGGGGHVDPVGVPEFVAIKKLPKNDERISAMLSILPMTSDPRIHGRNHVLMVRDLFQVDGDDDHVYAVTPWCHHGELAGQLAMAGTQQTPRRWYRQLLGALHYLQSRGVRHRALRPEDVLVDADRNVLVRSVGASLLRMTRSMDNI